MEDGERREEKIEGGIVQTHRGRIILPVRGAVEDCIGR